MPDLTRNLDHYLSDISNHAIKQDLEQLGHPNILGFFILLDRWVDLVRQGTPSEAVAEIEALNVPGGVTALILYHLRDKIQSFPISGFPEPPDADVPAGTLKYLDDEYERWKGLYPPDIYAQNDPSDVSRIARQSLWQHDMVREVLGSMIEKGLARSKAKEALEMQIRQSERERMESSVTEIVQMAIAATGIKRNPEYTLNRQVLAVGFILKYLGVKNIDKSDQARFIEFLVGKTYKDIYDNLRELDDRVLHRNGEDARYVIAWFQKLGLNEAAKDIEEILSKSNM